MHARSLPSRRELLVGAAAASMSLLSPARAAPASPNATTTLRIATFRGQDQTLLPGTGQDRFPYKVEYSEFNAGNLITQAINADAIDVGAWSEIPLVFAAAAHSAIRVVAVMEGPTTGQAVLVPRASAARSIADLKGRRVGYIRATTAHYFLIRMLAQHGLSFADIQPVALGMSAGLTAMKSGALDAWATYGYAIPEIVQQTGARVLQNAVGILSGNYLIGANPRRLADPAFRTATADYIERLGHAYAILDADKARWARLVAPVVDVPEPYVLATLREQERPYRLRAIRPADVASAQDVCDVFAHAGLLPAGVQVAPCFTDILSPLLNS